MWLASPEISGYAEKLKKAPTRSGISPGTRTPAPTSTRAEILDCLLELSPQVCDGPNGEFLVHLGGLMRYWRLGPLLAGRGDESHPLLIKLEEFRRRFGMTWKGAPSACRAAWALRHGTNAGPFESQADFLQSLATAPLEQAAFFLPELAFKAEERASFADLCVQARDLGFHSLADFETLSARPDSRAEFRERFGLVFERLAQRLRGQADFTLRWHQPVPELSEKIWLASETGRNEDPLGQVNEVLERWQRRLAARKSLLKGIEVIFRSDRRRKSLPFQLYLPKPTREVPTLIKLITEKWLSLKDTTTAYYDDAFTDEISGIRLRSLGLDEENDRQLDLFRPRLEETNERWNLLVARLQSRASPQHPIRIGRYKPYESWRPEHALEWVEGDLETPLPQVRDHPHRPELLYPKAQPMNQPRPKNEAEFWAWLESKQALHTLELLREDGEEREYAQVGRSWIYWSPAQARLFVHGEFEP